MKVPTQLQGALGPGEVQIGTASDGTPIMGPDDLGLGQKSFEGLYAQANQNLQTLQQNGASAADAINTLGDAHATPAEAISAMGTLGVLVAGVALYAGAEAGLLTFAAVAATLPVVGEMMAAFVAISAVLLAAVSAIFGRAQGNAIPDDAVANALQESPPHMDVPNLPIPAAVIGVWSSLINEAYLATRGQPTDAMRLQASVMAGGDGAVPDDVRQVFAEVFTDRWPWAWGDAWSSAAPVTTSGSPGQGFGTTSFDDLAAAWNGEVPSAREMLTAVEANPSTYLALFAVAARMARLPGMRVYAYTATYQLLLARGWTYKQAGRALPDDEARAQGVLLDLISQHPYVRLIQAFVPGTSQLVAVPLVKDLLYYVNFYLGRRA